MKNSKEDEYDDDGIDAQDEVEEQEESKEEDESKKDVILSMKAKVSSVVARNASSDSSKDEKSSSSGKSTGSKRKPKPHKFSGELLELLYVYLMVHYVLSFTRVSDVVNEF
ncbi:uncharacterized protein M6B38_352190 [Iris pallida]|uniref:Uncharacterized protein n=1 Tax=Iris pallida TaxID=29817 RepID=A0AAX6GRV3_IRIPA|nr:uncharacterized protein M6B38_352190 [Iris pallida]